jgi:hypothetical protein
MSTDTPSDASIKETADNVMRSGPDAPKKPKPDPMVQDLIALDEAFCLFNSNPPWEILTDLKLKSDLKGPVEKLQAVLMTIGGSKDPIAGAYGDCHADGGVSEFFMHMGDVAYSYAPIARDDDMKEVLKEAAHLAIGIAMLVDVHEGKYKAKKTASTDCVVVAMDA